jgi:hypothetical protein
VGNVRGWYPSDLTDEQWALVEPLLPPASVGPKGGRLEKHPRGVGSWTRSCTLSGRAAQALGREVEIVRKSPDQRGFRNLVAHRPPAPGPRLRSQPGSLGDHDPLGDDRRHGALRNGRMSSVLSVLSLLSGCPGTASVKRPTGSVDHVVELLNHPSLLLRSRGAEADPQGGAMSSIAASRRASTTEIRPDSTQLEPDCADIWFDLRKYRRRTSRPVRRVILPHRSDLGLRGSDPL